MGWGWRLEQTFLNPLIVKDGLSRVRSWRAPAVIGLYLGLLALLAGLVLAVQVRGPGRWSPPQVAQVVFTALALPQLTLVCLFTPGVAAGAINGERELQTLDVLLASRVTPLSLVWGKLVASVAFILLLVAAGLPLFATVFIFGGIDLGQFLVTQALTGTTALAVAAGALLLSALCRRALVSTVLAYGLTFTGTVGTLALGGLLTMIGALRSPSLAAGSRSDLVSGSLLMAIGALRSPSLAACCVPELHPLLYANPLAAMALLLLAPGATPMHVGRAVQLLLLAPGPPSTAGPALEAWQVSVLELAVVALSVAGAVAILRWRRPLARPRVRGRTGQPTAGR